MRNETMLPREIAGRPFGRKGMATVLPATHASRLAGDLKLFALTFVGSFLFVSLYLA